MKKILNNMTATTTNTQQIKFPVNRTHKDKGKKVWQ